MRDNAPVLCLTGGVGGAKLTLGLYRALPADTLTVATNTGDDFTHLGLDVWPDFDTTLYTLAGLSDAARGWGRADETWRFLEALGGLGGDTWFQLGDRDLALHVLRTAALRRGEAPGQVAAALAAALGVRARVTPATEASLRTIIATEEGVLGFQDYFVRRRAEPRVTAIRYDHTPAALPSPALRAALAAPDMRAIIIAPSNPMLSIAPVLDICGVREALSGAAAPVVGVSPIIGGRAVKGPTAKIMTELGIEVSPVSVARAYMDILDGFVIDSVDVAFAPQIGALGLEVHVAQTLMQTDEDKLALARETLAFADALAARRKRGAA